MIIVLLYFLALLTAVLSVTSSVVVVQPLDNQLPLIARVNQTFSWTFSPLTFSSSDGALGYTTSSLPAWLSFDASSQTFHGTPSPEDEGSPEITVTAHASGSSASSKFTLCVTHYPPPTLNIPISDQFNSQNPSISSVYFLGPNSAIATTNPTLRVPHKWSFSIGFEGNTFVSKNSLFYELRLANGSDVPDYMVFNSKTITLDGVVPYGDKMAPPLTLPFVLYASDQEGYTASTLPFTVVVADHELAQNATLPTINITTLNQFSFSLLSVADFTGILVDGDPIQPSNISTLHIDVSGHDWLNYDAPSRTLTGNPGMNVTGSHPQLPVVLTTLFNQFIRTTVTLALVPSYFSLPELPSLHVSKGDAIQFNLGQWFSNSTGDQRHENAEISLILSPSDATNWLRYDQASTELTGTVPSDYDSDEDHVTVTFTAYSQDTHSISHTSFDIFIADTGHTKSLAPDQPSGLSKAAHKRLVLVLVITFGLVGGLCLICGFFAIVRRWARVEDTAALGEEGRHAWSEKDRRWYGVTLSPQGTRIVEKPGRFLNSSPNLLSPSRLPQGRLPNYGHPGLGLRRVSERSQSIEEGLSPGVMSKREFMSRIKETVRQVSDKYSKKQRRISYDRPVIGKPILIPPLKSNQAEPAIYVSPSNPFDDAHSLPGSTFMTGSPSTSTAEHSIPRRRADFAPPRNLAQVHFEDSRIIRQLSTASLGANSLRSGRSRLSRESSMEVSMGPPTRPRLVPFTSSTRVPVPQALVSPSVPGGNFIGNRISSQRAKVCKVDSQDDNLAIEGGMKPSETNDELTMGIHYVRSLGADQLAVDGGTAARSSPTVSNVRSSFTSLESSHVGHKSGTGADIMKVLVRVGEKFKFRVPIPATSSSESYKQPRGYHVKMTSGQPLPKFVQADPSGINSKGVLELSGIASFRDLGEMTVGIYGERDGVCVATVVIEVVSMR
ncbi:hypothetical protein BYT27DRAFT_7153250 [Phlegmacium glaucopus]|nr:hypothetical protein BYT27DRAFT_7153250 [Phlegmacium glaucopus]